METQENEMEASNVSPMEFRRLELQALDAIALRGGSGCTLREALLEVETRQNVKLNLDALFTDDAAPQTASTTSSSSTATARRLVQRLVSRRESGVLHAFRHVSYSPVADGSCDLVPLLMKKEFALSPLPDKKVVTPKGPVPRAEPGSVHHVVVFEQPAPRLRQLVAVAADEELRMDELLPPYGDGNITATGTTAAPIEKRQKTGDAGNRSGSGKYIVFVASLQIRLYAMRCRESVWRSASLNDMDRLVLTAVAASRESGIEGVELTRLLRTKGNTTATAVYKLEGEGLLRRVGQKLLETAGKTSLISHIRYVHCFNTNVLLGRQKEGFVTSRFMDALRKSHGGIALTATLRQYVFDSPGLEDMDTKKKRVLMKRVKEKLVEDGMITICSVQINGSSVECAQIVARNTMGVAKRDEKAGSGVAVTSKLRVGEGRLDNDEDDEDDRPSVSGANVFQQRHRESHRESLVHGEDRFNETRQLLRLPTQEHYVGISKYEAAYRALRASGLRGLHQKELVDAIGWEHRSFKAGIEFIEGLRQRYDLETSTSMLKKSRVTMFQVPEKDLARRSMEELIQDMYEKAKAEDAARRGLDASTSAPVLSGEKDMKPEKETDAGRGPYIRGNLHDDRVRRVCEYLDANGFLLGVRLSAFVVAGDPQGVRKMDKNTRRRFVENLKEAGKLRIVRYSYGGTLHDVLLSPHEQDEETLRDSIDASILALKRSGKALFKPQQLESIEPEALQILTEAHRNRKKRAAGSGDMGSGPRVRPDGPMKRAKILHSLIWEMEEVRSHQFPHVEMPEPVVGARYASSPTVNLELERLIDMMRVRDFLRLNLTINRGVLENVENIEKRICELTDEIRATCVHKDVYRSRIRPIIDILRSLGLVDMSGRVAAEIAVGMSNDHGDAQAQDERPSSSAAVVDTSHIRNVVTLRVRRFACVETLTTSGASVFPPDVIRLLPSTAEETEGPELRRHLGYDLCRGESRADMWFVLEHLGRTKPFKESIKGLYPLSTCSDTVVTKWQDARHATREETDNLRKDIQEKLSTFTTEAGDAYVWDCLRELCITHKMDSYKAMLAFKASKENHLAFVRPAAKRGTRPNSMTVNTNALAMTTTERAVSRTKKRRAMDEKARTESKLQKIAAAQEEHKRQQAFRERQQQQQRALEAERRRRKAHQQHALAAKRSANAAQEPPPPLLPALASPMPPALHVSAWSPDDDRRLLRALRAWGRCPLSDAEWQELPCLPVRWQSCRERAAILFARNPEANGFVRGSAYNGNGGENVADEGSVEEEEGVEERLNAIVRSVHDLNGASVAQVSPEVKMENEAWKRLGLEAEKMGAAMRDAFPNGEMSVGTISIGEAAFALACAACGDKDAGAGLDVPSAGFGMPFDAITASAVVVPGARPRPGPFAFLNSRGDSAAASVVDAVASASSLRSLAVGVMMHRPGCEESEAVRHMMAAHGGDATTTVSACRATLATLVGEGLLECDEATVSGMSFVFYHAHPLAPLRLGTCAPPPSISI